MAELIIIVSIVIAFAGFLAIMYALGLATVHIVAWGLDSMDNILRYLNRRLRK